MTRHAEVFRVRKPRARCGAALFALLALLAGWAGAAPQDNPPPPGEGALLFRSAATGRYEQVPLVHTDVAIDVRGLVAAATVTQQYVNSTGEAIEAVYVFPLPHRAAVYDLEIRIGERRIRSVIREREEAKRVYQAAKAEGRRAALVEEERPNIFTASVANLMPGDRVDVRLRYVEPLRWEDGRIRLTFPMVVGPRYIPGNVAIGSQGGGWSPDTNRVPDASRITPPVAGVHTAATRAGHDISIEVTLDAGVPVHDFRSLSHAVLWDRTSPSSAVVRLKNQSAIPNKDFVLKYDVSGGQIEDAVLVHKPAAGKPQDLRAGGFFTLILQPPDRIPETDITPKEIVFVLDTSGSMSGFPIEKAKEAMQLALAGLHSQDTFNLITFAGDTHILFPEPVPATAENLKIAQGFLEGRTGGGGTEMMKAIRAALDPSDSQEHLRVVCFMTDGYVGNDMEIIAEVQKHPNARVFSFGIGQSVNRFLLDKMAEVSRGEVEYVSLNDDGSAAARRFHERVRTPLLTDLSIDWNGLPVADIYPSRLPDLFSAKPVIVTGRYGVPSSGVIHLRGKRAGEDFVRSIRLNLADAETRHDVLATLWARQRIEDLMNRDWNGAQQGNMRQDLRQQVTQLGLGFRLMTQFTSFVAVEEMVVNEGGESRRIQVPVEMPEGVSPEGVFGESGRRDVALAHKSAMVPMAAPVSKNGAIGSGSGAGVGGGQMGGVMGGIRAADPAVVREEAADAATHQAVLSPQDRKRADRMAKLDARLLPVVNCLEKQAMDTLKRTTCKVTAGSKVEIQLWLADKSVKTLEQLRDLGFETVLDPKTSRLLIGRVPAKKLAVLIKLDVVLFIAPQEAER